jgi:hypothetical protein
MSQLSNEYLAKLICPMPKARYEVDHSFSYVELALEGYADPDGLELVPDFQRGHVWTREQQERWMESVIRGSISVAGLTIQLNAPAFEPSSYLGKLPRTAVCIDGLQRLTAIRKFNTGEINVFGLTVDHLKGTAHDIKQYHFKVAVHSFQTKVDLLQYYIDLNAGGTPHSKLEIDRVIAMKNSNVRDI